MRYGFTTGSCAAAAAKAAAYMLLTGREKKNIRIETPKGITYCAEVTAIRRGEREVSCGVIKDGGDDPDVTTGTLICARVTVLSDTGAEKIRIEGGTGVGKVTRPGLDQPVGSAAINRVPRDMIRREVLEVCRLCDFDGSLGVCIYVPEGEKLAESTFNPRLGVTGGISILGTTGIVEPMSTQALLDTIRVELRQRRAQGASIAAISPGNYGREYMRTTYGYDLDKSVKCGNFIGETIDMAAELGFERLLLAGHVGKLVKLSGGIMNTHSREADCRMELLGAAAIRAEIGTGEVREILDCVTTEEALGRIQNPAKREALLRILMERIDFYLRKRAAGRLQIDCIVYSNEYGGLGCTPGAAEMMELLRKESVK